MSAGAAGPRPEVVGGRAAGDSTPQGEPPATDGYRDGNAPPFQHADRTVAVIHGKLLMRKVGAVTPRPAGVPLLK